MKGKIYLILSIALMGFFIIYLFSTSRNPNVTGMMASPPSDTTGPCDWSQYDNFYEEPSSEFIFCCKMTVNEEGDYGFDEKGNPIINKCEARPKWQ